MKRTKYVVTVGEDVLFSAPTKEKLKGKIKEDIAAWSIDYPGLTAKILGATWQANYEYFHSLIEKHDFDNSSLDIRSDGNIRVFPPSDVQHGVLIRKLIAGSRRDLADSVLSDWLVTVRKDSIARRNQQATDKVIIGGAMVWSMAHAESQINGTHILGKMKQAAQNLHAVGEEHEAQVADFEASLLSSQENMEEVKRTLWKQYAKFYKVSNYLVQRRVRTQVAREKKWTEEWGLLHDSYMQKLQYQAAVTLWETKATGHRRNAKFAFWSFVATAVVTAGISILVVFLFGDYIASSFSKLRFNEHGYLEEIFSYKGPITVAALLVVASLFIWVMRFASKIYLSERHLALASEERKAFAETYLALVADQKISREQEAIVLAALFRSGQDGIIRDDDGGLDISAASILAKAMSGNRS